MSSRELEITNPTQDDPRVLQNALHDDRPRHLGAPFIVYTDGACSNNGLSNATASWAVYAGPCSNFNACGLLEDKHKKTSSLAEIVAVQEALKIVERARMTCRIGPSSAIIITDSEYLVNSIYEWMPSWISNGGFKSCGDPVQHYEALYDIWFWLQDVQDQVGFNISIWHTKRDNNTEADRLAKLALKSTVEYSFVATNFDPYPPQQHAFTSKTSEQFEIFL
jgi:ribonuclease HI